MEELTLQQIREIELNLLIEFDRICNEKGYRYSLGGGTLLGAVRHKGFIPWDDDIDVMMPRPDYDKFVNFCENNIVPFNLITYDLVDGYYGLYAKISAPMTKLTDSVMKLDFNIGVNIDIFPIDGLGNSMEEAIKIFKKTEFERELLNASLWKKYFRSKTHSILLEPIRFGLFLASRLVNPGKLLYRIDRENIRHPFDVSLFAGCVCGSYREKEIMTKETFEHYVDVEFENLKFKSIANYDDYLKKHYGNYMQLPPEEKRTTHHTCKAYKHDNEGK